MLNRQGRILWVDFNDQGNKANENYFNGKNGNYSTFFFKEATAIIMNDHHEAISGTKCKGK